MTWTEDEIRAAVNPFQNEHGSYEADLVIKRLRGNDKPFVRTWKIDLPPRPMDRRSWPARRAGLAPERQAVDRSHPFFANEVGTGRVHAYINHSFNILHQQADVRLTDSDRFLLYIADPHEYDDDDDIPF